MSDLVTFTKQGDIGIVSVNNPPVNALSVGVRQGLLDGFTEGAKDDGVKAIILICEGRTFIAGADIKEFGKPPMEPWFPVVLNAIENCPKPVVAAIHGTALGGGLETALTCHYRVGDPKAKFGLPEVLPGSLPGAGGTQRLPRLVGFGIALELLITGRRIDAQEAYRIGLVNHVVPLDQLMDKALEIAREIGANAPLAVQAAKEAAYRGMNTTLQEGLRIENFESQAIRYTDDAKEGPRAFAEKREANYQGR